MPSPDDLARIIGTQIRRHRDRQNPALTQSELARLAGLSTDDRVSLFELGKRVPSITELERIAKVLGVPLPLLIQNEDDPQTLLGRLQHVMDLFSEARRIAMTANNETWVSFLHELRQIVRRAK
jgi:transcriptional regulator with XRE-family HTH domain